MIIREAKPEDINSIIQVLKASLGETSSRKDKTVWDYKHVNNPFGKSLVLVAEEDNQIVGVRAFMRWEWQLGAKTFKAFRAVDTATHPDYQGKGIFKKLTLKALEIGKESGDHFVFNTPNSQSKPGYLKMGWEEVGRVETQIIPQSPLRFLNRSNKAVKYPVEQLIDIDEDVVRWYNEKSESERKLFTPKTTAYLKWRYLENEIQSYFISSDENHFMAAYIKKRGNIKELRVSEIIYKDKKYIKVIKKFLSKISSENNANFISFHSVFYKLSFFQIKASLGPVLTFKNINCDEKVKQDCLDNSNWNYSLGDLELF